MGASSSCCFCIAKAEESSSPCTENDRVPELEMVGAEGTSTSAETESSTNLVRRGLIMSEMHASSSSHFYRAKAEESPSTKGASTSGRAEYYSARCEAMMRSRGQFSDDGALQIEYSKSHWSEVSRLEVAPQSAEEKRLNRENRELLKQLVEYPSLFTDIFFGNFSPGRLIAKGGQAEIYEVVGNENYLMKVFERGTSLRDLRRLWPLPALNRDDVSQCIVRASLLGDGRFAFFMVKCWGDLRKLIDQAVLEKNANGGVQGPPFPYKYRNWTFHPIDLMLGIALHMRNLHEKGISHRDLKASNILLDLFERDFEIESDDEFERDQVFWSIEAGTVIADFECSIGVLGTGFWRAPEILSTLGNQESCSNEEWKRANVYSYAMTCFEIATGQIPFDGELGNTKADHQLVIEGKRPQLPSDLDVAVEELITKCWAPNPSLQPTL